MNAVDAANKAEIDMMHAVLAKKFGQLYADIWKVGVNLSLRISDLLTLKYADLNLEERSLKLTEAKTGKLKNDSTEFCRYPGHCQKATGKSCRYLVVSSP